MHYYARIGTKGAEQMRSALAKKGLLDKNWTVLHSDSYVLFSLNDTTAKVKKLINGMGGSVVHAPRGKTAKKLAKIGRLSDMLSKREMQFVARGYDIMGNIAIVDISGISAEKEQKIAGAIMVEHPSVKTVLAKAGAVHGKYRTRKLRYIAGKRRYLADYRENGCRFVFDVRKTFFSNRLSFERARIAAMSRKKERVVVMFAGAGPFAIEIAKKNPKAQVVAIELNKDAYIYMCENIMINRVTNVTAVLGDVRNVSPRYRNFADRVVMPLPESSAEFIDSALLVSNKRSTMHLYMFGKIETACADALRILREKARAEGYSVRLMGCRTVRNYSPKEIEICVDAKLSRI